MLSPHTPTSISLTADENLQSLIHLLSPRSCLSLGDGPHKVVFGGERLVVSPRRPYWEELRLFPALVSGAEGSLISTIQHLFNFDRRTLAGAGLVDPKPALELCLLSALALGVSSAPVLLPNNFMFVFPSR